jgi:hypothetical protein
VSNRQVKNRNCGCEGLTKYHQKFANNKVHAYEAVPFKNWQNYAPLVLGREIRAVSWPYLCLKNEVIPTWGPVTHNTQANKLYAKLGHAFLVNTTVAKT